MIAVLRQRHRSGGREAEGGGLLNRYRVEKPYRGFESLPLRFRGKRALVARCGKGEAAPGGA